MWGGRRGRKRERCWERLAGWRKEGRGEWDGWLIGLGWLAGCAVGRVAGLATWLSGWEADWAGWLTELA